MFAVHAVEVCISHLTLPKSPPSNIETGIDPNLAIRNDVIGVTKVKFIDVWFCNELIYFDCPLALDGNGFQFFRIKLDILAFAHLITLDYVGLRDFIAGFSIDLAIPNPVASLFIELVKAYFFTFRGGGKSDIGHETSDSFR
jgi:hypothetical protein